MSSDLRKTEYFKYLLKNSNILEKQRLEFNDRILELLDSQIDELGIILKCHLIVEHYIDEYIRASYPTITQLNKVRLTFYQKLELINNPSCYLSIVFLS
jgi:hypothetical protein